MPIDFPQLLRLICSSCGQGRIAEEGRGDDDLMARSGLYAELWAR